MANPSITIIYGPQGSGKTNKAISLTQGLNPNEVTFTTLQAIQDLDYQVNPFTKAIVLDEVPDTYTIPQFEQLRFFTGGPSPIGYRVTPLQIICCVQTKHGMDYLETRIKENHRVPVSFINAQIG